MKEKNQFSTDQFFRKLIFSKMPKYCNRLYALSPRLDLGFIPRYTKSTTAIYQIWCKRT